MTRARDYGSALVTPVTNVTGNVTHNLCLSPTRYCGLVSGRQWNRLYGA
jgi:hypothetical protein